MTNLVYDVTECLSGLIESLVDDLAEMDAWNTRKSIRDYDSGRTNRKMTDRI